MFFQKGNDEFKKGNHAKAIEYYTYATELDPKNHIFFSNRATAYFSMQDYAKSLRDSEKAVALDNTWWKVFISLSLCSEPAQSFCSTGSFEGRRVLDEVESLPRSRRQSHRVRSSVFQGRRRKSQFLYYAIAAPFNALFDPFRLPNSRSSLRMPKLLCAAACPRPNGTRHLEMRSFVFRLITIEVCDFRYQAFKAGKIDEAIKLYGE